MASVSVRRGLALLILTIFVGTAGFINYIGQGKHDLQDTDLPNIMKTLLEGDNIRAGYHFLTFLCLGYLVALRSTVTCHNNRVISSYILLGGLTAEIVQFLFGNPDPTAIHWLDVGFDISIDILGGYGGVYLARRTDKSSLPTPGTDFDC